MEKELPEVSTSQYDGVVPQLGTESEVSHHQTEIEIGVPSRLIGGLPLRGKVHLHKRMERLVSRPQTRSLPARAEAMFGLTRTSASASAECHF
jgi:hypothetical protein